MRCSRLGGLAALLALELVGCTFDSDFSGLQFAYDTGVQDVRADQHVQDQAGTDLAEVAQDQTQPDSNVEAKSCLELLTCVLFEHRCPDFSDTNCPNVCADTEDWEKNSLFYSVYSALGSCQLYSTDDSELLPCLYSEHSKEMTACLGEVRGATTCPQAFRCLTDTEPVCTNETLPKPFYGCLSRCTPGISAGAQKGVYQVLSACDIIVPGASNSTGELLNQECVEGLQECFGDSGNRSCNSLTNCLVPSCLKYITGASGSTEGSFGSCVSTCLDGAASEKVVDLALASIEQALVPGSNIFTSLVAFTECIAPTVGSRSCLAVYQELNNRYDSADPHVPTEFDTWLDTIASVQQNDLERLRAALDCLSLKWDPSTEALNVLAWQTCRTYCN